jgi:hypothetical protein
MCGKNHPPTCSFYGIGVTKLHHITSHYFGGEISYSPCGMWLTAQSETPVRLTHPIRKKVELFG